MAEMLYEGKAKKVFATADPNEVVIYYKDDATALNGAKKGTIVDKGIMNNTCSAKTVLNTILLKSSATANSFAKK